MDIAAQKQAVFDWLTFVLGDTETVIEKYSNAPRPPLPYMEYNLMGPNRQGQDELRDIGAHSGSDFQITGPRSFLCLINSFGHDTQNPISQVQTSMSDPAAQIILRAAGLAFGVETPIIDVTQLINTVWEKRWQFEVTLLAHEDVTIQPGVIGNTEINSTLTGDNYTETNKLKIP